MRISSLLLLVTALISTLFLSACTGLKIGTADENHFDASKYHSYAWETAPMQQDNTPRTSVFEKIDKYFRQAINSDLASKGYKEVAKDQADFIVDYSFGQTITEDEGDIISPRNELEGAFDTNTVNTGTNTSLYAHQVPAYIQKATLELSLEDASKKELLWRSWASKIIQNEFPSDAAMSQLMNQISRKMLRSLPAQAPAE